VSAPAAVLLAVLAFALGSIPFGPILARLAGGIDLRAAGSGNPGAANVMRLAGPGWGIATLLLDAAKGWLAAGPLVRWLGPDMGGQGLYPLLAASCAVLGHLFSPWIGFRGGKGVATSVGSYLALVPVAAAASAGVFAFTLIVWGYVSLASLAMAGSFPVAVLLIGSTRATLPTAVWGALLALLIAWRHRANLGRLARGQEPKIGRKR
jgi:glycerol-3-phosphate acyltransferase PlsY